MAKMPSDGTEFHLRPGAGLFGGSGWRGVNTESDPGSLDPNELQRGDNLRLKGKTIRTRPGNTSMIGLGGGQTILWLHEAPVDNPRVRLWLVARGCFGTAVGTGAQIYHYDPSETPSLQVYAQVFAESSRQVPIGRFGDKLYYGDKSALREAIQITPPAGRAMADIAASPPQTVIATFPGFTIRWLREFGGLFFIGLENDTTATSSKIAAWSGSGVPQDDITGVRPPLSSQLFRDKLVVGFDSTAAHIRVRDFGTTVPGTWNTFALAGFLSASQGNAMVEARQYLYIASGTDLIHRFDGAALTLARTVATADVTGSGVTALALHDGLLHYGWNITGGTLASRIGRHDPDSTATEWVDTYLDVTTQQANFKRLSSMLSYRQQIYLGGDQVWLLASAANDVKGTLDVANGSGAPGAGFEVLQMLRFP